MFTKVQFVPLVATAVVLGLAIPLQSTGATAEEIRPALEEVDQPLAVPPAGPEAQPPAVPQVVQVRRPASVSDEEYAAEQAAASTGPAPLGPVAAPIPARGAVGIQATVPVSFEGLDRQTSANNGSVFIPPDTIVARTTKRVIEATNSAIRLSQSSGGILATRDLNSFFGAAVGNGLLFDPKVYFDRNSTTKRRRVYVIALQQTGRGNANLADNVSRGWLAISRNPNPKNLTTHWCRYNIDFRSEVGTADESWGDYPAIGAGRDSLSISINNFRFSDDAFRFARIHVFNKRIASDNVDACPSLTRFVFQPSGTAGNFTLFTIQPAQHYTSPSSGENTTNPAYFLSTTRGSSNQYHVHRVRNVFAGSPTYARVTLTSGSYGIPPAGNQPGTASLIDSGDNRMLQVAGIGNTLVGQFTTVCNFTSAPNESCTRAPRVTVGFGGGGTLSASIPENTFQGFGDNIFVHHPSIATDTALRSAATWQFNGTGGVGFFHSSSAMIKGVNANWAGVQTYAVGNCSYLLGRAGDYSGAQLDPSLFGFWLAGEKAITLGGSCQWSTRIVRVDP
jgi:hypothetical protein